MRIRDRTYLGDGCYGGRYEMPQDVTDRLWSIAVEETREAIRGPWLERRNTE